MNSWPDLRIMNLNVFTTVPRIANKLYLRIKTDFNKLTGFKKYLIDWAVKLRLKRLEEGKEYKHAFYDMLVFNKIRKIIGDVKIMGVGQLQYHLK